MSVTAIVAIVVLIAVTVADRSKRWIVAVGAVAGAVIALSVPAVATVIHMLPGM